MPTLWFLFSLWQIESKRDIYREYSPKNEPLTDSLLCYYIWLAAFCCIIGRNFEYVYVPFPHLVSGWGKRKSALSRRVESVSWMEEVDERRSRGREKGRLCKWIIYTGFLELFAKVMMADLSLSQSKLTMRTHTHSLSWEVDEVIGGCETCFSLIAKLEGLVEQFYTITHTIVLVWWLFCVSALMWLNWRK